MLRSRFWYALAACFAMIGCGSSGSSTGPGGGQVTLVSCTAPDLPGGPFGVRLRAGPDGTLYAAGTDASGASVLRRYRPVAGSASCAFEVDDAFAQGGTIADVDGFDLDGSGRIHAAPFAGTPITVYDESGAPKGSCDTGLLTSRFMAVAPDGKTRYLRGTSEHHTVDDACNVQTWQAPAFFDEYVGPLIVTGSGMLFAHQKVAYLTDLDGNLKTTLEGHGICYIADAVDTGTEVDLLDSNCPALLRFDHSGKLLARYSIPEKNVLIQPGSFTTASDGSHYALVEKGSEIGLYRMDGLPGG